jgi:hypothetical protein
MPTFEKSVASLRIIGDALIPEDITKRLGTAPSKAYRKGEIRQTKGGSTVEHKTGFWSLHALAKYPEDLNIQVVELLSKLTNDLNVWRNLSEQYKIDVFCGLFMENSNDGVTLSPTVMALLGERGIELGLDIYAPDDN